MRRLTIVLAGVCEIAQWGLVLVWGLFTALSRGGIALGRLRASRRCPVPPTVLGRNLGEAAGARPAAVE